MTKRELIKAALADAIKWQDSLAEAHRGCKDGIFEKCHERIQQYRKLLDKELKKDMTQQAFYERQLDT